MPSAPGTGYVIRDQLFTFCAVLLQLSYRPTSAEEAAVAAALSQHLGKVFEEVCRQYVWQHHLYLTVGRWWDIDPATKWTEKIDIVACNPYSLARPVCSLANANAAARRSALMCWRSSGTRLRW